MTQVRKTSFGKEPSTPCAAQVLVVHYKMMIFLLMQVIQKAAKLYQSFISHFLRNALLKVFLHTELIWENCPLNSASQKNFRVSLFFYLVIYTMPGNVMNLCASLLMITMRPSKSRRSFWKTLFFFPSFFVKSECLTECILPSKSDTPC